MNLTHNLTLEQIQFLPTMAYMNRAKPQHWANIESMFMSAHGNPPRILDTLKFKGAMFQLVDARLISIDCADLKFKLIEERLAPDLIVRICANNDQRGAQ